MISGPSNHQSTRPETTLYDGGYDEKNAVYIQDEFEIVEEPLDRFWDDPSALYEEDNPDEIFPCHPLDRIQTPPITCPPQTPPLSPFKIIKQTIHPNHSSYIPPSSSPKQQFASRHPISSTALLQTRDPLALVRRRPQPQTNKLTTIIQSSAPPPTSIRGKEIKIQRILLLNAYPIGYVLLWIPGIANRFVELGGGKSRTLAIAQASTQFVGLANASMFSISPT